MKECGFLGDEMNLHTPASEMSRAELEMISSAENNMIGSQASKPLISIVQDALLSTYLYTKDDSNIPKHIFFNICMKHTDINFISTLHRLDIFEHITKENNIHLPRYCGKSLFSLLLPSDFFYNNKGTVIKNGCLISGFINKEQLKSNPFSFIRLLHKEYSQEIALNFVNNVQFFANEYMMYHGFSVGIEDCIATKKKEIDYIITSSFIEAENIELRTQNPAIREFKTTMTLAKAKDKGMKLAKEALDKNNNFLDCVLSGSKGDFFNITQITGLLGQQNITGKRVAKHINQGRRTLPHFKINSTKEEEYKSRGFICNSFFHGLNPSEFWFHAMSGREGITDTAMKTANSGYIQRKMIKTMEDLQVKYDQTIRNSSNSIVQFVYGNDNLDARQVVLQNTERKTESMICNIERFVERINE